MSKSVYIKWRKWQEKNSRRVVGKVYAELFARLSKSPAARKCWQGREGYC